MAVGRLAALGVRVVGQLPIAGHATLVGSAHRARLLSASAGAPPPPPPRCGPLQDITVIDLTRVLAGPYCTLLLRELGARVIKVENPVGGDDSRHFGPWLPSGDSAYFETLNAGKESIGLDLKQPKDREALHALLARADVLIENFRPGVMDRMGLGWETLSQQYPRLCYTSISGFGQTGPNRLMSAYDCSVQALGGIMSVTGSASRPSEPIRVGISIGDIGAGIYAALGVTAALHHRAATGRGCQIDVSMLDCQVALLLHQYASHDVNGIEPTKLGSRHPTITPFQAYRAGKGKVSARDEEHFVIGAGNNKLFGIVAEVLGHPEWTKDARFASNATRTQHCAELEMMMEEALKERPAREWVDLLVSRGVPSALIHGIAQASVHPQIAARRMLVDHVCLGTDPDNTAPIAAAYPGAALTTTPEHTGAAHAPRKLLRTAGNPIKMPGILPDTVTRMRSPKLDEQGTLLRQEATEAVAPYAAEEARLQAQVARAVAQALRERPADAVARVAELLSAKE